MTIFYYMAGACHHREVLPDIDHDGIDDDTYLQRINNDFAVGQFLMWASATTVVHFY